MWFYTRFMWVCTSESCLYLSCFDSLLSLPLVFLCKSNGTESHAFWYLSRWWFCEQVKEALWRFWRWMWTNWETTEMNMALQLELLHISQSAPVLAITRHVQVLAVQLIKKTNSVWRKYSSPARSANSIRSSMLSLYWFTLSWTKLWRAVAERWQQSRITNKCNNFVVNSQYEDRWGAGCNQKFQHLPCD